MKGIVRTLLGLSLVFATWGVARAKCDPAGADAADVAAGRAAIAANCDCTGAATHGAYVKCASGQAKSTLTNKSCRGTVVRCASRSTCGKPGFIICCRTSGSGKLKCSPKKDCAHCKPPHNGTACCSTQTSCCGAAGASKTGACSTTGPNAPCAASPSGAFLMDRVAP